MLVERALDIKGRKRGRVVCEEGSFPSGIRYEAQPERGGQGLPLSQRTLRVALGRRRHREC